MIQAHNGPLTVGFAKPILQATYYPTHIVLGYRVWLYSDSLYTVVRSKREVYKLFKQNGAKKIKKRMK